MIATAADGTRLYYDVRGDGEPLLLISGQANDHHQWELIRPGLAEHFRTIVFDHRGTGVSDKPKSGYSTSGFAADAVAVLDAAGVDRAHVYGHSMGGRTAQWFGIEHPDRLASLILGATTPGDRHGIARSEHATRLLTSSPARRDRRAFMELMYTPSWIDAHPEVLVSRVDELPGHARLGHFAASQGHDAWERLPEIVAPALVLHGDDDELNPVGNAELLASRIPKSTVRLIDGARHGYHDEFAAEATAAVVDFLRSNPL